jgi:hypothetical protein
MDPFKPPFDSHGAAQPRQEQRPPCFLCAEWKPKRAPLLPSWLLSANVPHVLLDGSLADTNAQFQQFSPNPFSTPKPIVLGHLPDQGDRFRGDLGLTNMSLGRALPIQAKELVARRK